MTEPNWISLLPALLAIFLAIRTKEVYLSLFAGIYLGWTILADWNPLLGFVDAIEGCIDVFRDAGNTKVIIFSALIGALITLTQRSGGVNGFVNAIMGKGWVRNRRSAQLMSAFIGCSVFIESSITSLIVGAVSRPVYDRLKISREKLAYICDSTSAPVCILIPLNAWGAYIIGLLAKENVNQPVSVMIASIPLNFYAILAVVLVFLLIISKKDFGPMKAAEKRASREGKLHADDARPMVSDEVINIEAKPTVEAKASNMLIPVITMIIMMPVSMIITGNGDLTQGSGSTSVLWSVLSSIIVAALLYIGRGIMIAREISDLVIAGIKGLIPLAILMMFAFAIGNVTRELQTGIYVAQVADMFLNPSFIPMILFLISCFIAFSTGTSWGTFAIMVPIAVPVAGIMDIHMSLVIASVLGGGVFGDHCSPISDSTIVSSMAAASDHIDHVRTQLPYAVTAAGLAAILYLIAGILF